MYATPAMRGVTGSGSHGSFLSGLLVPVCLFSCFLSWWCLLSIQIRWLPLPLPAGWGSERRRRRRRRRRQSVGNGAIHLPPTEVFYLLVFILVLQRVGARWLPKEAVIRVAHQGRSAMFPVSVFRSISGVLDKAFWQNLAQGRMLSKECSVWMVKIWQILLVTENKIIKMGCGTLGVVSGHTYRILYVCMHTHSAGRFCTSMHVLYFTIIF